MSTTRKRNELVPLRPVVVAAEPAASAVPALVADLGPGARFAWDEFFKAQIRNPHTRVAYARAVRRFLAWCGDRGLELRRVSPGDLGDYFRGHPGSSPTKKQHLAALRGLFDTLVTRHAVILNPAASVRLER